MKLDEDVVDRIIDEIWRFETDYTNVVQFLKELDLVLKPGDSSQSVLVENCKELT